MAYILVSLIPLPAILPWDSPTFLVHRWAEKVPRFNTTCVECENVWHKVLVVSYLFSCDWLRNGTAPVARSPQALHRGTTWDHRCCWFMHEPCARQPRQTAPCYQRRHCDRETALFLWCSGNGENGGKEASTKNFHILMVRLYLSVPAICPVKWEQLAAGLRWIHHPHDNTPQAQSRTLSFLLLA